MFTLAAVVFVIICASSEATTCTKENVGLDVNNMNNDIGDSAFTSSTQYAYGYRAARGRLNTAYAGSANKKGGWMAATTDTNPWIEVDLQSEMRITGIITQGRQCGSNWVKQYQVQYKQSSSDNNFYDITDPNTDYPMTFTGNTDKDTQVTNDFPTDQRARYIRIRPTSWYREGSVDAPSMRFELIRCTETYSIGIGLDCCMALGDVSVTMKHFTPETSNVRILYDAATSN